MCYRVLKTPRMIITSPVKAEAPGIVLWGGKSYLCLSSPSWERICTPPPVPTPAWVQTRIGGRGEPGLPPRGLRQRAASALGGRDLG